MFSAIYIEEEIYSFSRVQEIIERYPQLPKVKIERYGEVFNRKAQNFRLQKFKPALILAKKHNKFSLPAPQEYRIGEGGSYYFSHMLNCVYDCRYCFLQGMYRSAHYVLFVNYEDFALDIKHKAEAQNDKTNYFYSGYDCDSLAFEPLSQFAAYFLPFFKCHANTVLELRTKSTQIRSLLNMQPIENCIVAFSFTPTIISQALEHKVPSIIKRIDAIKKLQQCGWKVGLRFDPLIYDDNYAEYYRELFESVFNQINIDELHSVSMGVFRLPETYFRNMAKLYPDEKLFAAKLNKQQGMISYYPAIEQAMVQYCEQMLLRYIPKHKYFPCTLG
ncbi:MAG: DNA photolyase [Gammaproteobacteria bacterium]|nr:DNA photolyase [Gammaproteobacteria bacterium]